MAHRTRPSPLKRPPIQRIIEEAIHRKMTPEEKQYFHIAPRKKASAIVPGPKSHSEKGAVQA